MALVVDTTVSYTGGGENDNVDFKLSKTLNQLTAEDIMTQDAYVGFTHFAVNSLAEGNLQSGIPENNPNHAFCYATDASGFRWDYVNTKHWCFPPNFPEGVYMRNILLYRPLNGGGANNYLNSNNRIVIDAIPRSESTMQDLYLDEGSSYGPFVGLLRSGEGTTRLTDNCFISPAIMMIVNNQLFIWLQGLSAPYSQFFCDSLTAQGYTSGIASNFRGETYHSLGFGWTMAYTTGSMLDNVVQDDIYGNGHIENVNFNGHTGGLNLSFGATNYKQRISESVRDNANKEFAKWFRAFTGFKFKVDDVWYKPIITGGIVTGYTDDFDVPSEWDNWTKATGHNVPSGGGGGGGDDAEAETFGWGGSEVAGMVRYFLLTKAEMENLQSFMSNANWRMDYRNCIISMYVVPNNGLLFDTGTPTTLKFRLSMNEVYDDDSGQYIKPPDKELDTGVSCKPIEGVVNNDNAVIEIPKQNDNFLDYEPYSKYFVYIPFCGVVPLPDYIVGKEIKITIYPDVPTCTCTAIVTSESRKIATISGSYGSELPLTSDGSGLKAMSVINSIGNILIGAGELALGVGTGNLGLSIAGGATMLGSALQADMTMGQAFGYSIGASGDTSFFGVGTRCEYYIAYPQWDNPDTKDDVESNIYGHTFGFVVNQRGKLSDFEGFTVCDNPHVYGFSCTAAEKEEIEMLLRQGIIIHHPSE